jgi:hypothetical protein
MCGKHVMMWRCVEVMIGMKWRTCAVIATETAADDGDGRMTMNFKRG